MPVNASPEFEKAESRYRQAGTPTEQLSALQEMLRLVPKHKGSEKVQSNIKRKLSTLRREMAQSKSSGGQADPFHVPAGGAGQVTLMGLPNTGKSSIVAAVTQAPVKVADYPFSSPAPVPGMWLWQDVQIQMVDTPAVTVDHAPGGMINLLLHSDVVAVVADAADSASLQQVETALEILSQRRVELFDCPAVDIPDNDLRGKPGLLALTHADRVSADEIDTMAELLDGRLTVCGLDCITGEGFDVLADHLWRLLHIIRVYTKRPGQQADRKDPFTLPVGATVEDLARAVHRDLPDRLKFARIWGQGHHDGQQVHRTAPLGDRDVVEIHE